MEYNRNYVCRVKTNSAAEISKKIRKVLTKKRFHEPAIILSAKPGNAVLRIIHFIFTRSAEYTETRGSRAILRSSKHLATFPKGYEKYTATSKHKATVTLAELVAPFRDIIR